MERSSSSASLSSSVSTLSPSAKRGLRKQESNASLSQLATPTCTKRLVYPPLCAKCDTGKTSSLLSDDDDLKGLKNVKFVSINSSELLEE
jgi:hypothetical protein